MERSAESKAFMKTISCDGRFTVGLNFKKKQSRSSFLATACPAQISVQQIKKKVRELPRFLFLFLCPPHPSCISHCFLSSPSLPICLQCFFVALYYYYYFWSSRVRFVEWSLQQRKKKNPSHNLRRSIWTKKRTQIFTQRKTVQYSKHLHLWCSLRWGSLLVFIHKSPHWLVFFFLSLAL